MYFKNKAHLAIFSHKISCKFVTTPFLPYACGSNPQQTSLFLVSIFKINKKIKTKKQNKTMQTNLFICCNKA